MNCLFDKCELINGIILGLLSSFLASWFTYLFLRYRQNQIDQKRFKPLAGLYRGQTITDPTKPTDINNPTSQATIEHISNNRLVIQLTDYPDSGHNKWIGEITMESEIIGTVIWHYERHEDIDLSSREHLFGLKKIIRREIGTEMFIYLIDKGFPDTKNNLLKEVFKKVK